MALATKDPKTIDSRVPAWQQPAVLAAEARIRELTTAVQAAQAHAAQFPQGKMTSSAMAANEAVQNAEEALATARLKRDRLLDEARTALRAARSPREDELRRQQFLDARVLQASTQKLLDWVLESKALGCEEPSPVVVAQPIIPFITLIDERPYRESILSDIERDLRERGIDVS